MRQRYLLAKEGIENDLTIKEFAIIDKDPREKQGSMALDANYTFLHQEVYKGDIIKVSIAKGIDDLMATLRTDNLFPASLCAEKIAASVMDLYHCSEDRSIELFFNDTEQF